MSIQSDPRYAAAVAHHEAGALDAAEPLYRALLAEAPDAMELRYRLSVLCWQRGALAEALRLAEALPTAASTHVLVGNIHFSADRTNDAIAAWERALAADPDQPMILSQLGLAYQNQGDHTAALTAHRRAVEMAPAHGAIWYNLGLSQQQQGDLTEAEVSYREALRRLPDDPEVLNNLGNILQTRDEHTEAIALYARALEQMPEQPEFLYNLGASQRAVGALDAAITSLQQVTRLAPEHDDAWIHLGMALGSAQRFDEAVEAFREALRLSPQSLMGWINLGHTFRAMGRENAAFVAYQTATRYAPEDATDYLNAGVALQNRKQRQEAIAFYRRALEMDPNDVTAQHLLDALTGSTPDTAPEMYISELFDNYAHSYDEHLSEELDYRLPALLREAVDGLKASRFGAALDLGCGTGLTGAAFRDIVDQLVGVDLSEKMLAEAEKRRIYDALHAAELVAFLEESAEPPERFDLFVAGDVLVYIGDLEKLMAAVTQRAQAGAVFVFSTERAEGDTYLLRESGRFAHGRDYIRDLVEPLGWTVRAQQTARLRKDRGRWMNGDLHVLTR